MKWPPTLSWTCKLNIKPCRYFVAINYGVDSGLHWVNMTSVIDGDVCFVIDFEDLKNQSLWSPGWIQFNEKELSLFNKKEMVFLKILDQCTDSSRYLSKDSGLTFPLDKMRSRDW